MKTKSFITMATLAVLLAGCQNKSDDSTIASKANYEEVLSTVEVGEGPVRKELRLTGKIKPDESRVAHVVTPFGGKTVGVHVETGDRVSKGSTLAVIQSTDAADHLREIRETETELRIAQRDLEMKEKLLADGLASEKEVDEAKGQVRMAESRLERLQTVAGINGYTGQFSLGHAGFMAVGAYVSVVLYISAGEEAFVIADLGNIWVEADVYESDISRVKEGADVEVEIPAWPGETCHGVIDKIYGALDSESKTMKVRVSLSNPDLKFRPGMFANLRILTGDEAPVSPFVPTKALVFENGRRFVVIDEDGQYRKQEVEVAFETEMLAYISKGLSAGQQVVGRNALLIYNELEP